MERLLEQFTAYRFCVVVDDGLNGVKSGLIVLAETILSRITRW